jgi:hypothetical protein
LRKRLAGDSATGARPQLQALLRGLTAEQAHAVIYGSRPLLVPAGPGAGKTRTLIHRITWLLTRGLARPVGNPAVNVQRPGRWRAEADGSSARAGRGWCHGGDVSLGVRPDAARGRHALGPHRELHHLLLKDQARAHRCRQPASRGRRNPCWTSQNVRPRRGANATEWRDSRRRLVGPVWPRPRTGRVEISDEPPTVPRGSGHRMTRFWNL